MKVTLYRFEKRTNSTANPIDSSVSGIETPCHFKDNTSFEAPIIQLNSFGEVDIAKCNYCYIDELDNYYWIDDIVFISAKLCEIHCSIDPLASYKDEILEQSAYVLYSSSRNDPYLPDARIPLANGISIQHDEKNTIFSDSERCVIFATVGGEENSGQFNGGYNFYVCYEEDWSNLLCKLSNSSGIGDDIKNYFGDAANSFIFARRVPISMSRLPFQSLEDVWAGKYSMNYRVTTLGSQFVHPDPIELTVPSYKADFRNWEPYTKLQLYFPFLGAIDLAANEFGQKILIDYVLDLLTGLMTVNVCNNNTRNVIASYTTEFGEPIPIVSNQTSIGTAISSGIGAAGWGLGAVAAGSSVMGITAIMMASSAITSAVSTTSKQHGSFGGSKAEQLKTQAVLLKLFRNSSMGITELNELYGRPLGRVVKLSTLTGYCQTREYKYKGSAPKNIIESIEQLVDGGIYIE